MKEKEEDEERNENICRQRTDNQVNKREPTFMGPLQVWPMVYI